jgi:tRNA (guanine37-N1)-methyltransferase
MVNFYVITIFPEVFESYLKTSILGRAQKNKLIKINLVNLRDFTVDKHKTVDDKPYGGGPGMVFKIKPIYKTVHKLTTHNPQPKTRVILFSTRGKKFNQKTAKRLSKYKNLILICGRYEGVDERVAKYIADEELSIGDYILSGGELPAMVLIEAVSRHLSGVLGKEESLEELKGSYPVYTRPEVFVVRGKKWCVPKVLLSGDHKKIKEWRKNIF